MPELTFIEMKPLCVDLDGSLLATDVLWEAVLKLLKTQPWQTLKIPFWIFKGKAYFKRQIARRVQLDCRNLPLRKQVLDYLIQQQKSGRNIVLTTASDELLVEDLVKKIDLFSGVLASDGKSNLSGKDKLKAIKNYFGHDEFDYIGDALVDLPLWQGADQALVVNPSRKLLQKVKRISAKQKIFQDRKPFWITLVKAVRVHQWVKNLLLLLPLFLAHKMADLNLLIQSLVAMLSFSFCASAVYILNDLLDLESDRKHPVKCKRPFAAGDLQIRTGFWLAPLFIVCGFSLALWFLPRSFVGVLVGYLFITTAYSFYLKKMVIMDVLVLAGLYTFRVIAGGMAVHIEISTWLLAFSMFLFISLAFLKRCAELAILQNFNDAPNEGRGYLLQDQELLRSVGPTSGYLAMLVLAFYINSNEVLDLYKSPKALWLIGPFYLYWITRIWILAHRGVITDDPVVFTLKDRRSYVIGACVLSLIYVATNFSLF